jgi:hypothetical protein
MKCKHCDTEFTQRHRSQLYCCPLCKKREKGKRQRESEKVYNYQFEGLNWDEKCVEFKKTFAQKRNICPKTHCVWAKNGYCVQPSCFEVIL